MLRFLIFAASIVSVVLSCDAPGGHLCMTIYNKCPFDIWPGIQGRGGQIANGGFYLGAGDRRTLHIPFGWKAARIWARTSCNGNMQCETGGCGNKEACEGRGGQPPVSLAEFTLNGGRSQDFYDVSLVDGYNIPVLIEPVPGTYNPGGGNHCKRAGGCVTNLSDQNVCPQHMQVWRNGRVVACKSACAARPSPEACCSGRYAKDPRGCINDASWEIKNYRNIFKQACPTAYAFAYDDATSTFVCKGTNGRPSPDYVVQFC